MRTPYEQLQSVCLMRFSTSGNLLDGYRNGTKHHHCIVFNASHCPEKFIELAAYNELQ